MKRLLLAAGLTLSVGALATAAILGPLRGIFHRARKDEAALDERERVRRVLAPILSSTNPRDWFDWLDPLPESLTRERLRELLPPDLNLSSAIVEEREKERRELGL